MEKEENQNNTSADQKQDAINETEKPDENLVEENKQETDQEPKEEIKEPTPEEKIAELEDKVARTFAEMENQRRRFEKEKEDAFEYGGYSFAKEALNLIDNLDRSKHVLESDDKLKETEALKKIEGVEKVVNTFDFQYELSCSNKEDIRPKVFDFAHDNDLKIRNLQHKIEDLEKKFRALTQD